MGRNPKPTALLKLEKGKLYDQQRARDLAEPKAEKEIKPVCPEHFNKKEKEAWKGIALLLNNYGLFIGANALQLEFLATAYVQYNHAQGEYRKNEKPIVKGTLGGAMVNPYLDLQIRLRKEIIAMLQAIGLSSMSLAKIGSFIVKAKKEKDEMESLLD